MSLRIYGNRALKTLPGQETRPTLARVREAVFNIWQGTIEGCRWLDVCAGIGSMGAEALSRGAIMVTGIERSKRACAIIRQNWQQVATEEQTFQVLQGNVLKRLPALAGQQFDRIYFDPPYASDLYSPIILAIAQHHLLAETGELAVEHSTTQSAETWSSDLEHKLEICRRKQYGSTALTFFRPARN